MPRYKVHTKSFIENHLREEGDIIEYNGKYPHPKWELIDDDPMPEVKTKGKVIKKQDIDIL